MYLPAVVPQGLHRTQEALAAANAGLQRLAKEHEAKTVEVAHTEAQYVAKLAGLVQLSQQHQAAKARQEQELKQAHDAEMELLKTEREQWLAGHDAEIRKANSTRGALKQSVQVCCHSAYQHSTPTVQLLDCQCMIWVCIIQAKHTLHAMRRTWRTIELASFNP